MPDDDVPTSSRRDQSEYHAVFEMHHGRLDALVDHIRNNDGRINPTVGWKLVSMIEGDPSCFFKIVTERRSGLAPNAHDERLQRHRDLDMAIEVARLSGFKRGLMKRACGEVGRKYGLSDVYVARRIKPHRDMALDAIREEEVEAAYRRGEVNFLGQ